MIKDFETVDKWFFDYQAEFEKIFENVHLFEPLDIAPSVLFEYFYVLYRHRCLGFPYDICTPHPNNSYTISKVKNLLTIHAITNAYKYKTLMNTMNFIYNPIENYNMDETLTVNFSKGSETTTVTHEGQDIASNIGTNTLHSKGGTTMSSGSHDTLNSSTTTQIAPYNESLGESTYTTNKVTVSGTPSTTTEGSTDSETTNTETLNSSVSNTYDSSITTDAGIRNDITFHELKRNGNIGVTTTQQMIEQERNIADFDILKIYFNDIENLILLGEWS